MIITNTVTLTRMDNLQFPLIRNSGCLFYVLFETTGLELIYVTEVYKSAANKLMAKYCRVLSTRRAAEESDREEDIQEVIAASSREVNTIRRGRAWLRDLAEQQDKEQTPSCTFHRGDVSYTTEACNLVGFVGWRTAGTSDQVLLTKINGSIPATYSSKIRSLADIDSVICGDDFSDHQVDDGNCSDSEAGGGT